MEYDGLRYIKIYSTGASASSLGIPLPRWGVDCICAIFYNIGSRMDPNLKQRIIEEAYRLFITKGMKQTSFCDVAVAVHKSKGAVIPVSYTHLTLPTIQRGCHTLLSFQKETD